MTIARWNPPVAPTRQEQFLLKRLGRVRMRDDLADVGVEPGARHSDRALHRGNLRRPVESLLDLEDALRGLLGPLPDGVDGGRYRVCRADDDRREHAEADQQARCRCGN